MGLSAVCALAIAGCAPQLGMSGSTGHDAGSEGPIAAAAQATLDDPSRDAEQIGGPVCGNGVVEAPEQCDDGGTTPGDGCDASCDYEPFDCDDEAYFSMGTAGETTLRAVDMSANPVSFVDVGAPQIPGYNALAYNSGDGFMYGMDQSTFEVYRIFPNGERISLGIPTDVSGLTDDVTAGAGTLDGNYLVASKDGQLATLDVSTTPPTTLSVVQMVYTDGTIGLPNFNDLAVDPVSGRAFAFDANTERFVSVDRTTGDTIQFGPVAGTLIGGASFFDGNGRFFVFGTDGVVAGQDTLYQVDLRTGTTNVIATGPEVTSVDATFCPSGNGSDATISVSTPTVPGEDITITVPTMT